MWLASFTQTSFPEFSLSLSERENLGNEFTFTSWEYLFNRVSANDLDLVPERIGHSNLLSSECMNAVCLIN